MTLRTIHIESYKAYKRRKLNMNNNFVSSPDKLMGFDHNNPISDELFHRNHAHDAERQKLTWKHQQELATFDRYYQREILYLTHGVSSSSFYSLVFACLELIMENYPIVFPTDPAGFKELAAGFRRRRGEYMFFYLP
jgi:hypothetical protein